jgi:glycosyltransferase involved in cell wall biosynthesis
MSWKFRTAERLHALAQRAQRVLFPEKRRVRVILVSGYERTRASLRLAGVPEEKMVDVLDSGVDDSVAARPRAVHTGHNPRFACSGRMVDHKGTDLAIRAVAAAGPDIRLDIYGDGEKRAELEALVRRLGLQERVRFLGWMPSHDALLEALSAYRGYVFPSLAEANGIVMQEAMMLGLPVIATRWGGPAMLADDTSAVYVDPVSEDHMIRELARAMDRLATDPDHAERLSQNARAIAEKNFPWKTVARSWMTAGYGRSEGA